MKIAINLSLAVQMLAFSEGVLLAEKAGIDARDRGRGDARVGDRLADGHLPRPVRPRAARTRSWFDCNMMQKDMNLALELGRAARGAAADDRGHERAADRRERDGPRRARLRGPLRRARRDGGRATKVARAVTAERDRRARRSTRELALDDVPADDAASALFEEQANELYRSAKMPGLDAPLHRRGGGRGRRLLGAPPRRLRSRARTAATATASRRAPTPGGCSPSCSARRPATAAARAARCTSPTTRTATSARTRSSAARPGSRPAPRSRRSGAAPTRSRSASSARARSARGSLYEVMNMAVALDAAGRSTSARTTSTTSTRTTSRRRPATILARAARVRDRGTTRSTARTCARCTRRRRALVERARAGGGPAFLALQHVPLPRPPRRRRRPRLLPLEGRGGAVARASATRSRCTARWLERAEARGRATS